MTLANLWVLQTDKSRHSSSWQQVYHDSLQTGEASSLWNKKFWRLFWQKPVFYKRHDLFPLYIFPVWRKGMIQFEKGSPIDYRNRNILKASTGQIQLSMKMFSTEHMRRQTLGSRKSKLQMLTQFMYLIDLTSSDPYWNLVISCENQFTISRPSLHVSMRSCILTLFHMEGRAGGGQILPALKLSSL